MVGDRRGRVLLVDDDDSIRQVVTVFLTDEGYDVAGAGDGQAALDLLPEFRPDIILLDNMQTDLMRHCVQLRDKTAADVKLEASGGINLQTIGGIAATGVDRISVGALTHSAVALDIALDYLPADAAR